VPINIAEAAVGFFSSEKARPRKITVKAKNK
jgi:hypothetical protein